MNRTEKQEFVAALAGELSGAAMVVVTRNGGLSVAEATELRRRMRAAGARYKVAKNRLALRAIAGTPFSGIAPLLKGPTALAWSADPVAVAKAAIDFAKSVEKLEIVGGALGARVLDAKGVAALAELPPLDVLRGKIVGLLKAPATKLAGLMQAPGGQVARVLAAYAKDAAKDAA